MKIFELKASPRTEVGKKATKQVRNQGLIPCVIYGGEKPVHVTAPINDFRNLLYTPHVYLVDIMLENKTIHALLKDIQFHPVSDAVLHIDFIQVHEDKPAVTKIPVVTKGFAEGVQEGGRLKTEIRRLKVKALPKDFPDTIEIDVTDIELGQSIKVRDLNLEGLELLDPADAVVASVKLTRVAKGMAAAEGEEEEEGEVEGEGEEGEETSDSEE